MTAPHTVVETPAFLSKASKIMSDDERVSIVDMVATNPRAGVLIQGTGGLRKARFGIGDRGRRGGGRVIYWFHSDGFPAVLLWAFAKNEASDLTASQKATLAQLGEDLLDDFRKGKGR
ncbi:hypothetical protein GCM10019059_43410 [Camelimonas fluminis]|uniref:Addiction module toxin RelE n=1 Tax=Camelimonas fluminis TaxID=1576911 RepID=A0ABV7UBY8_9HYPH|nr:addiction module toxin RelE [Camelimonas fluminis]GHE80517.1 hypothetical protein GCM10019059_43410 [Camelimonas fluminis]